MKTRDPKLFYLVIKVFGFLFLFGFTDYCAQVTLAGGIVIIDNTELTKDSSVIITSGTYLYDREKPEKANFVNALNKGKSVLAKIINSPKKLVAPKKQKLESRYQEHCNPADNKQNLNCLSVLKTAFVTGDDHHKKHIHTVINGSFTNALIISFYKTVLKSVERKLAYFRHQFNIRPPPFSI